MDDTVLMAEMSWPEYEAKIKAGSIVMLPVGSIEQHSHHMPLGVDRFLPTRVARDAAERLGAIVAEPIIYGCRSQMRMGGGQTFGRATQNRQRRWPAVVPTRLPYAVRSGSRLR
jgi:creatinine amidohydrolase